MLIEILEFKNDDATPLVRLGCTCGDPLLAAYHCEDDQIIFCANCGDITSRERLRNEATFSQSTAEWKWGNVIDRDECPLINVSIPVAVTIQGETGPARDGLAGCVTKISTDRCFLRLEDAPAGLVEALERRHNDRFVLISERPPLNERTGCELEDVVRPQGATGPIYYKLKIKPHSRRHSDELKEFYQTACGLRFDCQVLVYCDKEHASRLRHLLVDCLPMARIEIATDERDFARCFCERDHNLLILPPLSECMRLVKRSMLSDCRPAPRILALLKQRTASAIAEALRWGAHDILHCDCDAGELRHALQRCLEQMPTDGAGPPAPRDRRRSVARDASHRRETPSMTPPAEEIVQLLLMASETHDPNSSNHLKRIASYCATVTKCLGWDADRIAQLATASKLHDAGKIGVPDEILRKTGALTQEERQVMQQHTRFGYHILQTGNSPLLRLAAVIALRHHEHYNGQGYPDGLAGEAIPIEAQVVSVADVFDALTTARPYKPAWSNESAIEYLEQNKGRMFAPAVVAAFLKGLPDIRRSQLAFLDDFRDIWTERRQYPRHPIAPIAVSMEIAMPDQTFRPFQLLGHLINIGEGGVKVKITNVTSDLFSLLVSMRRYAKLYCTDPNWQELNNVSCEVVWIDYHAVPDPNACIMGLSFQRARPNLLETLRKLAETTVEQAHRQEHPVPKED